MNPADQCNYCAEPIRWMTTSAGKHMPVNAEPDPGRGNVVRLGHQVGVLNVRQATAARARGVELYLHHAVTCPYAARWQGPKGKRT